MSITSTEMEIKVSNGRITNAELLKVGRGKITIVMNIENPEDAINGNDIVLCEASKLSLDDEFMKHNPGSNEEKIFKNLLEEAIKSGLKDFYRPVCDPSLDEFENIYYRSDAEPATDKTYSWWEENAKLFYPERGSRLGTRKEYIAFLGILIKKLSDSGWSIAKAWRTVCKNSRELGHYWNSPDAKQKFEFTKSRKVCDFYDLSNTSKILSDDEGNNGFWIVGGSFFVKSFKFPLSMFSYYDYSFKDWNGSFDKTRSIYNAVGWIVFEK